MPVILTIEKIVHGGSGLARTDAGAVLVPGALPGEKVLVEPAARRRGMTVMRLLEIREYSPVRRPPQCGLYGECGACDWLHIEYSSQMEMKCSVFKESMGRIGRISDIPDPVRLSSPEFGYRRRAQLKVSPSQKTGFYRRGSNTVVPVCRCPLLTGRLNALLGVVNQNPQTLPADVRNLRVIDGDDSVASDPVVPGHTQHTTTISSAGSTFTLEGSHFFQGNRFLLEKLGTWAEPWCAGDSLVDLYGGAGFFSVMLAHTVKKGWLVEADRAMADQAAAIFKQNCISHFKVVGAVAESMEHFIPAGPACMIMDPPRPGLTRKVREAVARNAPGTIVYVSCNCATQARDCGFFCNRAGYDIVATALFDLYPNTHHSESIVVLKRADRRKF